MSGLNKLFVLLSIVSSLLLLSACGSDDAETASAPKSMEAEPAKEMMATESATSEESTTLSIENIEKAEGVIYQDEIYANWPE